jgi:aspartyl protease family protein
VPPFVLRLLAVAAVVVVVAVAAPGVMPGLFAALLQPGDGPAAGVTGAPAAMPPRRPMAPAARSFTVEADRLGHYVVAARINGSKVEALIDTGATAGALTAETARRLGIVPARSDFDAPIATANGVVLAARARLASVEVGGVRIDGVDALVVPGDALGVNLLGMSFLGRLSHYEASGGELLLVE